VLSTIKTWNLFLYENGDCQIFRKVEEKKYLKISVLTPSYNSGKYLERAIESVLKQNYPNVEHIVADACSTDNTLDVLKKYPHIKWVSEKDKGQSDAMNKSFLMSSGDIISYLNADDYYEADVFHTVNDFFQENNTVDFLVGDLVEVIENDASIHPMIFAVEYKKILLHFKYGFPFNPVAYFYKRKVQEDVGLFPIDEHYAMDYWFLLEAWRTASVTKMNKLFGVFYKTGLNKTSNSDPDAACKAVALAHCEKYDTKLLRFYKNNFYKNRVISTLKKWKEPFKAIVYVVFFSSKMNKEMFNKIGFKQALRYKG